MGAPRLIEARLLLLLAAVAAAGGRVAAQDTRAETRPESQGPATSPDTIPIPRDHEGPTFDLSLELALRMGRLNNTDLRAAELVPLAAIENLRGAQALFEPEVFGAAGYGASESPTRNIFTPSADRVTLDGELGWRQRVATGGLFELTYGAEKLRQTVVIPGFPNRQYTNVVAATLVQPLLRGAWSDYTLRDVQSSEAQLAGARRRFERSVQDTLLAVVRAYWELVFARENYRVVVQSLELSLEQLRITNERIRVRELAQRDRVADEADVARRREELLAAANLILAREDALRRLVFHNDDGTMWGKVLRPVTGIPGDQEPQDVDWRVPAQVARMRRPDLMALQADVLLAEVQLRTAENEVLPRLDLSGTFNASGIRSEFSNAISDAGDLQFPDWTLRLEMSVPVGNTAAVSARERARLDLERVRRQLYSKELDVDREVRDAVREVRTLAERIRAAKETVRLAETNLDTEQQKLRVGIGRIFDVPTANQDLREARSRLLRNQLDFQIARVNLLYVQGLLEDPAAVGSGTEGTGPR